MNNLFTISPQGLSIIFAHFIEDDYKVIWIRNPDYSKQIYLGSAYQTVWHRSCESLYEHPDVWGDYLVGNKKEAFVQLLKSRRPFESEYPNKNNTVLYRITRPCGRISWIKDNHFYLFNTNGNQIAVAGIATAISETQWQLEVEKNCSFEEDKTTTFQDKFINILKKELKLNAQFSSPAMLLDENHSNYRYIIINNNEKIKLTKREIECISQLSKGMTSKQIAKSLAISPRTVETYIDRIKDKTHSRNCIELVCKITGFAI